MFVRYHLGYEIRLAAHFRRSRITRQHKFLVIGRHAHNVQDTVFTNETATCGGQDLVEYNHVIFGAPKRIPV